MPGVGPTPCDLVLVGEAPGYDEVHADPPEPFVGKSGRELTRYLDGDRLPPRDQVYITNVCKQLPVRKTPSAAEVAHWRPHLARELARAQPNLIVALGATALRWFVPEASVERCHGLPVARYGKAVVLAAYHPAATLHNPDLQSLFAGDMEAAGLALRHGVTLPRSDEWPQRYRPLSRRTLIPTAFSLDTEGTPDDPWCVTISWAPGEAYIVHPHDTWQLDAIRKAVASATRVTCQGQLADLDVLAAMGIEIPDRALDDTQIMAYLLQLEPLGLKDLAYRHLRAEQAEYANVLRDADRRFVTRHLTQLLTHAEPRVVKAAQRVLDKAARADESRPIRRIWMQSKFSQVVDPPPVPTLDDVPYPRAMTYACRDADLTERLRPILFQKIQERGLERVYRLDVSVLPIVNRMQHVGMRIDPEYFQWLIEHFEDEYFETLDTITATVGDEVNPNSGPQVARLLFEELGLPPTRLTKSQDRFSTEDKYLEALRAEHPVVPLIIDGRELTKLKSAFAAAILSAAQETARGWHLYPHLRITRVVSGRVSAHDPNVLAIPKHSDRGNLIRQGFLAEPDCLLVSVDLSQIELRVAAHECQDVGMMKAFSNGADIHAALGERIFGIKPQDQDESKHRLPMKKANFGYWMGISAAGMRDQLHAAGATEWTVDRCQEIIREYDRVWPRAAEWKEEKINQARRYGYVTDLLGRRRYLAGVHSPDKWIRLEAERQAHATPIQAGAQEVFKTWMARIWTQVFQREWRQRPTVYAEPWLQVHDDFLMVVSRSAADRLGARVRACIPQMLRVPVEGKQKQAERWGDL